MQYGGDVYRHYKEQSVFTMTQGELLNVLYDEAIKRLKAAKIYAGNNNLEEFEAAVQRAREIVMYLDQNLDRQYEVGKGLHKMYDYFNYQLARAKAAQTLEPIEETLPLLEELRDAFKEADKLSRQQR